MLPILTPRLRLRRFTVADLDALVAYRSDPLVARFQSWDETWSTVDAEAFLAADEVCEIGTPDGWVQIAAELRSTGEVVGDVAVHTVAEAGVYEVGITFARAHQGHGLATEALGAVVDALFTRGGAEDVFAETDDRNEAVHHLLGRLGFTTRRIYDDSDEHITVRELGLSRDAWTATRP